MYDVPFRPVGDYAAAFAHRLFEAIPHGITVQEAHELQVLALANVNEVVDVGAVTAFYKEQFKVLAKVAANDEARQLMLRFAERELPELARDRRPRFLQATLAANQLQAYLVGHPEHLLTRSVDVEKVNVTQDGHGRFTIEVPLMPGADADTAERALRHLLTRDADLLSIRDVRMVLTRAELAEWALSAA